MTPDQIVAFVLALAGPPATGLAFPLIGSGAPDPRHPVTAMACPGVQAPYEVEGTPGTCGKVSLPENHDKPDGRRIAPGPMVLKTHSQPWRL
jgi:hypothetical protein